MLGVLGLEASKRLNFRNMRGADFAHILDVGVADGTPDLYARFPDARLELFEPHPIYQAILERTVVKSGRATLHKVALGREDGIAKLFLKGRTGSSMATDFNRGSICVPVCRLDAVLKGPQLRRPCLLKIDTEGYEMAVLEGAGTVLDYIDAVVVEIHFLKHEQYAPSDIIAFLSSRGFRLCEVLDYYVGGGSFLCADFVFRRQSVELDGVDREGVP